MNNIIQKILYKHYFIFLGYFYTRDQPEYNIFRRVAMNLKDNCEFYVNFDQVNQQSVMFHGKMNETYMGNFENFKTLYNWCFEICVPLVRELTVGNGEELYREGLPFLLLFYRPEDQQIIETFNKIVRAELYHEKGRFILMHFLF